MTLSTLMLVAGMNPGLAVLLIIVALIAGAAAGFFIGSSRAKQDVNAQIEKAESRGIAKGVEQRKREAEAAIGSAEMEAERIRSSATKEAEDRKKAALVEAKDEIFKLRTDAEKEIKDRIKSVINVGVIPKAVEIGDLPRSEKKSTRVFDYRY